MDPIKLRNFRLDRGKEFPDFMPLSQGEVFAVRKGLAAKLGLPENAQSIELVRCVRASCVSISEQSVESDGQLFERVVSRFSPGLEGSVLLNWGQWEKVDRMACRDVVHYFEDIWYPKADDIDILDGTLNWIVSVDYDGYVHSTYLSPKDPPSLTLPVV